MLLTVLILGASATLVSTRFLDQEQARSSIQRLDQLRSHYETILEEVDSLNIMFSTNASLMGRLSSLFESDSWTLEDTQDIRTIRSYISAPANARPYIDSIYVFQENSRLRLLSSKDGLVSLMDMEDRAWHQSYLLKDPERELWTELRRITPARITSGPEEVISVFRAIYNGLGTRTGVIVLNLLAKHLREEGQASLSGEIIRIHNEDGEELLVLGQPEHGSPADVSMSYQSRSDRFGWTSIMEIPAGLHSRLSRQLTLLSFAIALGTIAIGLLLTSQSYKKESRFVRRILQLLEGAKNDDVSGADAGAKREIFDYLTEHILQTFLEQEYLKVRKEAMEYSALQMQINPHFIFNTLETINWRVIKTIGTPNEISEMIYLMSRIMKYAISFEGGSVVPLREEIEYSKYYLSLQAIRFPGRFKVLWDLDETLINVAVPRLILQPILENCFRHGLTEASKTLEIRIRLDAAENPGVGAQRYARLSIGDNGPGITEKVQGMDQSSGGQNGEENSTAGLSSDQIGLRNVRKRIQLSYRQRANLSLEAGDEGGTIVLLKIPVEEAPARG